MITIKSGVDSVEISRVERSIRRDSFVNRVFSQEERRYFAGKHRPGQSAAGHFAAKEAVLKALGAGITKLELWEVGITHDALGAPQFLLTGWAERLACGWSLSLSITHTNNTATAFVVAYREDME